MSLVNVLSDTVPTEEDINNWMLNQIMSGCPMAIWMFTMQKIVGVLAGVVLGDLDLRYVPTEDEMVEFKAFGDVARNAQLAGREERAKRILLLAALEVENGTYEGAVPADVEQLVAQRADARRPPQPETEDADDAS